jgi:hypothetical protein
MFAGLLHFIFAVAPLGKTNAVVIGAPPRSDPKRVKGELPVLSFSVRFPVLSLNLSPLSTQAKHR